MKAELLILGVLHRGNFHPYEIKRRLLNGMVQCYTDVDVGTLYYAIRQLAKARLIAAVSRERVARGGVRTVYSITPTGKERFQQLLHECFAAPGSVSETLYGALLFMHWGDLQRMADLLAARIERQAEATRKVAEVRRQLSPLLSSGGLRLLDHLDAQRRLDQKWLQALLADVVAGKVRDVPDPRQLAAPVEKAAAAERKPKRRKR
ncbi:MAG: PadR family transcriptional regulator [Steroidobacteraceae bacterium]